MSKSDITHQIRIQPEPEYWYTVEDFCLSRERDGLTISCWDIGNGEESRVSHVWIEETSALHVADAIYKLFKQEDNNDTPTD